MVYAVDILDRPADRGIRCGGVPQARAARGGHQGARLVQGTRGVLKYVQVVGPHTPPKV
jgi:hypothetical protein